jgi:glycosyltransferase involved in cell wall biosynthesis
VRVCLIYDCLFPHTVGGAERWYRNLGERLAAEGHEVEYLTLRQWDRGVDPAVPGVRVRVVGPRMSLYAGPGRRRILPPLVFGLGVLWHLLRHGRRYDVVHTASFPYFSLLAAGLIRPLGGYRLVVDWHEVWTREYWREYLGRLGGDIGWLVQRVCVRLPQRAFCFSELHGRRLLDEGLRGEVTKLDGEYDGPIELLERHPSRPVVVYAGRHIPEKRVPTIPPAVAEARRRLPDLQALILGDGPDRPLIIRRVGELGLDATVDVPGFVSAEEVDRALGEALCLLLPSRREGYGMVVIEAARHGTPSVVVADPDNAAVELVETGVNGFVARSAEAPELAAAIVRIHDEGEQLRASTAGWFARNAQRLSLRSSLETVVQAYAREPSARS